MSIDEDVCVTIHTDTQRKGVIKMIGDGVTPSMLDSPGENTAFRGLDEYA